MGFEDNILKKAGTTVQEMEERYPKMLESIVPLSALGISARVFFNWRKLELMGLVNEEDPEPRQWVRLNLVDVVWVKIIQVLREFGFPIEEIKEVRKQLFYNIWESVAKIDKAELFKILKDQGYDKKQIDVLKDMVTGNEKRKPVPVLEAVVAEVFLLRSAVSLIIYKHKKQTWVVPEGYSHHNIDIETITKAKDRPHFTIQINVLIREFVEESKNEKYLEQFGLFSAKDKKLFSAIMNKEIKAIEIRKDKEEKLIITTSKSGELADDKLKELKRILGMNEYSDIRIFLRNGKQMALD